MPNNPTITSPLHLRDHTAIRNTVSHERILALCQGYKVLYDKFLAIGGELDSDLFQITVKFEHERAYWQQRSARLKSEAKRQARHRAEIAAEKDTNKKVVYDESSGEFRGRSEVTAELTDAEATLPSATQNAIEKWKAALEKEKHIPDTAEYKKSGLV